ncbi:sodium-dependent transporter, partial [candidate division KSB1 bacterium]|nr:sodium-dependent transporter [candidate division KSB1 bacterium]
MEQQETRGVWSSKIGFILAAAGSAVGLGNIWRFPYMTGMNGGAAFVVIYLIFVFLLGFPIMLNELIVGRRTQRNPVGALENLAPATPWKLVGGLGVLTGFGILAFYSVIAGWTLGYIVKSIEWGWFNPVEIDKIETVFKEFINSPMQVIVYLILFMFLTMMVVYGGVKNGIERWNKILMPILLGLLILMIVRAVTLPGAMAGISFYLKPDFSKINDRILIEALSQAFFSLSLGMGAMVTYGSYLSKKDNMVNSALMVCSFDTLIALLAGMAIFPAIFALGMAPTQGPHLIFVVLPIIFMKMPAGAILGPLFFILLTIAALTSTVSLMEVVVAYFIDEKGWKRHKAVIIIGLSCTIFAILAALSMGISPHLTNLPLIQIGFFDVLDKTFSTYSLTIGAFLLALFVGWRWGLKSAIEEVKIGNESFTEKTIIQILSQKITVASIWSILLKYIAPIAIFILILDSLKPLEHYRVIGYFVSFFVIETIVLWAIIKWLNNEQVTLGRIILVPIIRLLFLFILGP